jgi:hypothetical protein
MDWRKYCNPENWHHYPLLHGWRLLEFLFLAVLLAALSAQSRQTVRRPP